MKNQDLLNGLKAIPMLDKNIFYSTNTSILNLEINKTQEAILMAINDHQNKSMCELSRFIGLEKSSYTRSVDILVEKGFLEKISDIKDKRKIKLNLTPKGKKSAILIDEIMDIHLDNICKLFTIEEKNNVISALKIISDFSYKIAENKIGG